MGRAVFAVIVTAALLSWTHGAAGAWFEPREPIVDTSSNWAGYALTTRQDAFRRVSATWTQPAANCGSQGSTESYAAIWVGLDGDGTSSVEQTGTEISCWAGQAEYSAWIEMYPNPPLTVGLAVNPGDVISASVSYLGAYRFRLSLVNHTTGHRMVRRPRSTVALRKSAEVIVEAPSSLFNVLPLADFGTVNITGATVDGLPIGQRAAVERLNMVDGARVKALVSPLVSDVFTVDWQGA